MYPTNHYMDPYHSHYRSHTPYPYYPPQGWEIPSGHPRTMDSSCRPPTYGPWPYNAGIHHPHSSEFHCCCNHTYPPDYYSFRPPLPQELPPPHLYYHGPFPQHSNASLYFVPSHPYPVDQMPHGYDKLKSHCCGCPNHVCEGAEKSNVKIKEENPDVKLESEQKDSDGGTIIRHPKNQYPFIWLPSGNMEGKENGKLFELSPQLLNGWAPVKSTGDAKRQEQDNQEEQFHWPIVWMPTGYDGPKQKAKEMKEMEEVPKALNNSAEAPRSPKIKIIPLSWFENDHRDQKPAARDGSGDHSDRAGVKSQPAAAEHQYGMTLEASPKTTPTVPKIEKDERTPARENYKTIPVEPKREIDEKKASTYRTIPVIQESDEKKTGISEKKEANKASNAEKLEENGKTKHSESSTAKHAKLPPVCLRLDPLPRRKSGNGSSRSPSPPTSKDGDKAKKDVKDAQSQNLEPKESDTKHITMPEVKGKSPDGMKGVGVSNKTVQAASAEHSREEEVPTSKHDQKVQTDCTNIGSQENAGGKTSQGGAMQENASGESLKGCDNSTKEDRTVIGSEAAKDATRTCRTNFSEHDAAVRIQCAYRGYDVRRWQPLDKLRNIRDVHEQMQGVKKQLQCLEDSCKKLTEKEQVAIGETIMNLLLKLDTIQGLHPSVREARKSVARELVCLQEKLDTLCKKPSGEFNHTKGNEEKSESSEKSNLTPDSSENIGQIATPTVTTEASDKKSQERAVEPGMVEDPPSVDSVEPCDAVPSVIPMEVDAGASEQQNQNEEEPCTTTMEEAHEKGKTAGQDEFQVASSMDMMSDAALPEHPTENQEHVIEGSNAVSVEQFTEEKPAVEGEGKEVPLVNSTESFPDAASSGDSSGLKQCTASTEQNLHAESNTGLPSASTEDVNATAAATSVESGVATEKDVPLDSQMQGSAAVESLELKHDVSPAEENQQRELSGQVVHLEDSSLSLQVEEQHDLIPAEAGDNSMLERAVDTNQDSTKEPDGTTEASMNNMALSPSADTEKPDLEPTLEPDSALEQTVLDETDDPVQCKVYGKDEPQRVDQKAEPAVDKLTGASMNGGDSRLEASMKEPDIQESYPNLVEEADDSCELSCGHEGGITGHERSEEEVSSESQTDAQKEHADVAVSETYECTEMLTEAPEDVSGANSAEDAGVQRSLTEKCSEMPEDAQVGASGANSAEYVDVQVSVTEKRAEEEADNLKEGAYPAEEEADNLKEAIAVHPENKASEEALSAATTPDDGTKDNDEKKLAEENQQLKELLQKLLASGNDQMGVITDLSEKVKALERKLARKKRPKVRVHKPSRHATAKVH